MEKTMNRFFVLAFVVLASAPGLASAVEIKNVRPCWGPFGATRFEAKCLPGDVFFITYDIDGLMVDKETKKVSYTTKLELFEGDAEAAKKGKPTFTDSNPHEAIPALGGGRMPGDLIVTMPKDQKPGTYTIKLTIQDKVDNNKGVAFIYEVKVLAPEFGFIHVLAPSVGFPGQHHVPAFSLVNFTLDPKTKQPEGMLTIRILDETKKEVAEVATMKIPDSLPRGTDLAQANIVRLDYPVRLNRTGRFTIEIIATDKLGKKDAKLIYPLTVLDVGSFNK
jgi:hypothetical protein